MVGMMKYRKYDLDIGKLPKDISSFPQSRVEEF